MKKIVSNLFFMIKFSFKFAPFTYLAEFFDIIWGCSVFVDLYFTKRVIDILTEGNELKTYIFCILIWTIINVGLLLTRVVEYSFWYEPYSSRLIEKENMFYENIDSHIAYSKLENGLIQDQKNRMRRNLWLSNFAYNPVGNIFESLVLLVGTAYIITTLQPIILVVLSFLILSVYFISKKRIKLSIIHQKNIEKILHKINFCFNAMTSFVYAKEIRINRASKWLSNKLKNESQKEVSFLEKYQKNIYKIDSLEDFLVFLQTIILYGYSVYCVFNNKITIGDFTMYIAAVTAFATALTDLIKNITKLQEVSYYIDLFKEYTNQDLIIYNEKNSKLLDDIKEIEFKNVSFKYPNSKHFILNNVNVKIRKGEKICVVGYNGAGKSTFIKLLCRLYQPTEGVILCNGINIKKIPYEQYLKFMGVMFQDFNLYSLSVLENICLNRNIDLNSGFNIIEYVGLNSTITSLEKGIYTSVGREFDKDGVEFSGGEQQKIAFARTYVKNSSLVIFDEPTAALDPISEMKLYEVFEKVIENKTLIYISHRLSSVKLCDKILVFDKGKIVESGTHKQLVQNNGLYNLMFSNQSSLYDKEALK